MAFRFGILKTKINCYLKKSRGLSFFRRKSQKKDPYVIVRPTRDEYCDILQLMWDSYHPHEPTTKSINLGYKHNSVFDDSAIKKLSQGYSYVAKCKYTGCIVGASINSIECKWDADDLDKFACTLKCKKTKELYHFWAYLQRVPNIYDKYCVDCVFEIQNLFVSTHDRGKGLAYKLAERSKILGSDAGFPVIRIDATSSYTAKICEKLKMQLIQVIPYCAYVDGDNKPIFRPEPPNSEVKIYVDLPHLCH